MPSDSNSSTSSDDSTFPNPDQDPNPNSRSIDQSLDAIEDQLSLIALAQQNDIIYDGASSEVEVFKDAPNGSILDEGNHHDRSSGEIHEEEVAVVEEEVRESWSVWRRINSELDVDQPSGPSSSGYAGERGSSSGGATSASGIEEVGEDHVCEAGNGRCEFFDGALDSQAPGKRQLDEF